MAHPYEKLPPGYTVLARNSSRQYDRPRWTEIELSRSADGEQYRLLIIGQTIYEGEEVFYRLEESTSAHVIVEALAPFDEKVGHARMTWAGKKTLLEASELDSDIANALEDFEAALPSRG